MQDGKCYIEDMNSTNGLLYHGKRAKRVHVTDGDYIRIIAQKKDAKKRGIVCLFGSKTGTKMGKI